ncbi:MAG: hypothetical protein HKM95_04900, partial [Inquilinus sp.]|nr:hypothetical protein [Inquilinus sp.]
MKLTLYQPQVSASVLSQPGGGRRPFESPVAAGLGRLGSAVDALEKRRQTGRDAALAADALARFRKDETAALRRQAKDPEALGDGFAERALRDFEIRRDKTIAALKEQSQAAADRFAEGAAAVAETVRAGVLAAEASAAGGAIAGQVSAALGAGMETLREDPDQYAAILGELDGTIDVLAGDGFPAEAADRLRRQSGAKLAAAAIEGMIAEDPAAVLAALDDGAFAETLEPTERERWAGRARRARDREAAATEAGTAASQAGLWREFERAARALRLGEQPAAGDFDDEAIRAALPADQADKMILLRDRAEAEGAA